MGDGEDGEAGDRPTNTFNTLAIGELHSTRPRRRPQSQQFSSPPSPRNPGLSQRLRHRHPPQRRVNRRTAEWSIPQAATFQGDPFVATAVVVHEIERDQERDAIAIRGQLQPVKQWPPNPAVTLPVNQIELLVCLEEHRTAEAVENCHYETDSDRNTLITHNNDARAYLVEAKTLTVIDTFQFNKAAPSCPIDHQFQETFRTEKLEGPALTDQEIQDWINRLD